METGAGASGECLERGWDPFEKGKKKTMTMTLLIVLDDGNNGSNRSNNHTRIIIIN